jgi:hypothetical protein
MFKYFNLGNVLRLVGGRVMGRLGRDVFDGVRGWVGRGEGVEGEGEGVEGEGDGSMFFFTPQKNEGELAEMGERQFRVEAGEDVEDVEELYENFLLSKCLEAQRVGKVVKAAEGRDKFFREFWGKL